MTEISERYRRLATDVADKVAAVPDDRWSSPSPCEEWTARDVVRHLVDSQSMFLGLVKREMGPVPSVDEDPAGAWKVVSARVLRDLETPELATESFQGYFGPTTFEEAVDRFVNFDLVVHGWDLARAAGLDDTIDPQDVSWALAAAEGFGEAAVSSGVFKQPVPVPDDADDQTKFLAAVGRPVGG